MALPFLKTRASAKALGGTPQESGRMFRIEVTGILQPGYPYVRRSATAIMGSLRAFIAKVPRNRQKRRQNRQRYPSLGCWLLAMAKLTALVNSQELFINVWSNCPW